MAAIGDVNPILEANTIYYDLLTGEVKMGMGNGLAWSEEEKACIEPAPTSDGPYARQDDTWVCITGIIIDETRSPESDWSPSIEEGQSIVAMAMEEMEPYQVRGANLQMAS